MTSKPRHRILLADDHRIVAEGLKSLLQEEFDLVGFVEDGRALLEAAAKHRPDVIVADIGMPLLNGIDALAQLKRDYPSVKVVLLTMHTEVAYARRALELGASGYVLKHAAAAELVSAIRAALDGQTYIAPALAGKVFQAIRERPNSMSEPVTRLTPRQREILQLFAEGGSAKEVASRIGISTRTVEFHKYQIMETLGVHTTAELVHIAIKHGILSV